MGNRRSHFRISIGNRGKSRWHCRNRRYYPHYYHNFYYYIFVCILAIILPVRADEPRTTNVANPQAAITGSVANQAVQINQGSLSTQSYGKGHYCNGSVLSITPYVMQTESRQSIKHWPSISQNFGVQASLSVPLDGGAVELCKELARRKIEKERLDYELVRVKECVKIMKLGYTLRPDSPFYAICADVIPVSALPSFLPSSPLTSEYYSRPVESQVLKQ